MKKIQLKVDGMTCSACSSGLEKFLRKQTGIVSANVNLILGMVEVEYEDLTVSEIEDYILQAGFSSKGEYSYTDDGYIYKVKKRNLVIFAVILLFLMYFSMGHMLSFPELFSYNEYPIYYGILLLFISILFLVYGFDILKSGFLNLIHRMPNMDTLVLFSVFFSFFYSVYGFVQICVGNIYFLHQLYFESLCMVIYFVKLGRFIENISKNKTTSAIKNLVTITPREAIMKKGSDFISVSLDEIQKGDVLICRPGEKFAVCNAGGGFAYVGAMQDSFPHALELSKQGYNAFALIYRPGAQTACEDLARAISFIFEHAEELEVDTDGYSLWGGSAGARMAAWLGSYGPAAFGGDDLPRPLTVVMQYTGHSEYTESDPSTFVCVGENDGIANWRTMERRVKALDAIGINTEFHHYPGLSHGFGIGTGTVAEGWVEDAIHFWEEQMEG